MNKQSTNKKIDKIQLLKAIITIVSGILLLKAVLKKKA